MRPDIVITDELAEEELSLIGRAMRAGITVIASAHFASIESVTSNFQAVFQKIVVLDNHTIGKIIGIYEGATC